jgi:hypothetical protein
MIYAIVFLILMLLSIYCVLRPTSVAEYHVFQLRKVFGERVAEPDTFMIGLYRVFGVLGITMLAASLIL